MELDKTESGNRKSYKGNKSEVHKHPEKGYGFKEIAPKEKVNKESAHIRNSEMKEGESQGGVSDSLKGGGR